jgi:hypothetical protein
MAKFFPIREQSRTELAGLFTGAGYSSVLMGFTIFTASGPYSLANSTIFSAKLCQLVAPLPQ